MSLETLKAFGAWLSNMAYWTLEPVLGGGDADDAADTAEGSSLCERHQRTVDEIAAIGSGMYASQGEAIADGGDGIETSSGLYM